MTETYFVCRNCGPDMTLEEIRAFRPVVTVEGNATYRHCPRCGSVMGVMIDGGTLDLGLIRDELEAGAGDYEVFGEPPP